MIKKTRRLTNHKGLFTFTEDTCVIWYHKDDPLRTSLSSVHVDRELLLIFQYKLWRNRTKFANVREWNYQSILFIELLNYSTFMEL